MEIADDLTHKAYVKGSELFLLEEKDADAYGIENPEIYTQGGRAFLAVLAEQEKTRAFVQSLEMQIERLAGFILKLSGAAGLAGWQWIFLLEGTTTILLGIAILFYLTDRPEQAHWLESEERNWLIERLRQEEAPAHSHDYSQLRRAFTDRKVWQLIFTYSCVAYGLYQSIYCTRGGGGVYRILYRIRLQAKCRGAGKEAGGRPHDGFK